MKELAFPFESKTILRKRRAIKKQLLADGSVRIKKKIAVLGGSTTDDVVSAMELFLLNFGIEPEFYQSEYNKFYEDAVFGSPELDSFSPDIIYIHTTSRNLTMLPESPSETPEQIQERLDGQFEYFKQMWISLTQKFSCPIIQNNFELPLFRHSGNYDGWGYSGTGAFINRLNVMFSDYARNNNGFYINDINYLSSVVGLTKWHDTDAWFLYKYAVRAEVIPDLAYSVACIIKSVYGKNQKVIVIKEVQLSATIEEHDIDVKFKATEKFLKDGNKVKATIRFRGRQITHSEIGRQVMPEFAQRIKEYGTFDKAPQIEGRNMSMMISPKDAN